MKYLAKFEKQNNNVIRNSLIGAGLVGAGALALRPRRGQFFAKKFKQNNIIDKSVTNKTPIKTTNTDTPDVIPVENFKVDQFRTELVDNPLLQMQYAYSVSKGTRKGKPAVNRRRMQLETMQEYLDLKDKRIAKTGKNAGNVKKTRAKGKSKKERQEAIDEIKRRKQALVSRINTDREMGSYFNVNPKYITDF